MGDITKNFSWSEFEYSYTAKQLGIDNSITAEHKPYIRTLCMQVLQPLRDALGPVNISSGYRSIELNKAIKGASTSQHCRGQAADIKCVDMAAAFDFIRYRLDFDQLIWEYGDDISPRWIHVSCVPIHSQNRLQVLRCYPGPRYIHV